MTVKTEDDPYEKKAIKRFTGLQRAYQQAAYANAMTTGETSDEEIRKLLNELDDARDAMMVAQVDGVKWAILEKLKVIRGEALHDAESNLSAYERFPVWLAAVEADIAAIAP